MQGLMTALLMLLVLCAVAVSAARKLLSAVIIFMSYSLMMSLVWLLLRAPDLAMTEAAVGAGITSVLFFISLRRLGLLRMSLEEEGDVPESSSQESLPPGKEFPEGADAICADFPQNRRAQRLEEEGPNGQKAP